MSERSIEEGVLNTVLVAYLIREAKRHGNIEDDLKIQKLVFLAEKKMVERKLKGLSYNFFRWHRGPYSGSLKNDLRGLISNGLITKTREGFRLADHGEDVLKQCEELLTENSKFTRIIDSIVSEYARLSPDQIKEAVYNMPIFIPVIRKTMRIGDIEEGQLILCKISDKKAAHIFDLNDSWQATLELILDSKALDMLRAAQEDAVHGRISNSLQANPT